MIDWYRAVVGAEVTFQDATRAWLTNDAADHRIAPLASPDFAANPIGVFVDAARVAELVEEGDGLAEIHRRAMAGELMASQAPAPSGA